MQIISPSVEGPDRQTRDCVFCGWQNDAGREICQTCKQKLISESDIATSSDEILPSSNLDLDPAELIPIPYQEEHGFSHPDWKAIWEHAEAKVPAYQRFSFYYELSKQWLLQLKSDIGGNYRMYESTNFLMLCDQGREAAHTMLGYAENSREALKRVCGPLFAEKGYGKHVLLVFGEEDDYYTYISHFYRDGSHSRSGGVMLNRGYVHIAFPFRTVFSSKHVITHELVHNVIAHLRVPHWVHEAVAQKLERLTMNVGFRLDRELASRHRAFWNQQNIQDFWSGRSFDGDQTSVELSYSLAEILCEFLSKDWDAFLDLVLVADDRDAGQDAAVQVIDFSLGDAVSQFLGPGDWRPNRKAIAKARSESER